MEFGVYVLLFYGWVDYFEVKFFFVIFYGYFFLDFGGICMMLFDLDFELDYSVCFGISGYNRIQQQEVWDFYQMWMFDDFLCMFIVEIQYLMFYYDDLYVVNLVSQGFWGDVIMYEFILVIEEQFCGIGEGWVCFIYGGSIGGWEVMVVQVFYLDDINGVFIVCFDLIDFCVYMMVNFYEDENVYYYFSCLKQVLCLVYCDYLGYVDVLLFDLVCMEGVKGSCGWLGDQFDIWQVMYLFQGDDGYFKLIWDCEIGVIDKDVVEYW